MTKTETKTEDQKPKKDAIVLEVGVTYVNLSNVSLIDIRKDGVFITMPNGQEYKFPHGQVKVIR